MAQAAMIDRQTTTPFLIRLFFKQGAYHRLDEFDPSLPRLPNSHLQIYTWQSCSLRELCKLLLSAVPTQLPQPYAGARIAFRLVYPDMQGSRPGAPGRFVSRDIGSVVVGARTKNEDVDMDGSDGVNVADALRQLDGDPDRTLADAKFIIGDYIACAILPPLPDGGVPAAPPPVSAPARGPPSGPYGGGRGRENGFSRRGDFGYERGGGGRGGARFDDRRLSGGVPSGEWRRGEAPPEREPGYGRGRGRGGGSDSGDWRGRGRGRW